MEKSVAGRPTVIKTAELVHLTGQKHWQGTGVAYKETCTVEARTGWTVEGRSITVRDALRGTSGRFGAVRWEVKMVEATPGKAAKPRT